MPQYVFYTLDFPDLYDEYNFALEFLLVKDKIEIRPAVKAMAVLGFWLLFFFLFLLECSQLSTLI